MPPCFLRPQALNGIIDVLDCGLDMGRGHSDDADGRVVSITHDTRLARRANLAGESEGVPGNGYWHLMVSGKHDIRLGA